MRQCSIHESLGFAASPRPGRPAQATPGRHAGVGNDGKGSNSNSNSPMASPSGSDSSRFETVVMSIRRKRALMHCRKGDTVKVARDPDNAKDPNAIKLTTRTRNDDGDEVVEIGFVPKGSAIHLTELLAKGDWEASRADVIDCPDASRPSDCRPIRVSIRFDFKPRFASGNAGLLASSHPQQHQQDPSMTRSDNTRPSMAPEECKVDLARALELARDGQRRQFRTVRERLSGNFNKLIAHALAFGAESHRQDGGHLFDADAISTLHTMRDMSTQPCFALFVRLVMRKGPWFAKDALRRYVEVEDLDDAMLKLVRSGLFAYRRGSEDASPSSWVAVDPGVRRLCGEIETLYFLDGTRGLETFILQDHGIVSYFRYKIVRSQQPIFTARADFVEYRSALKVEADLHRHCDGGVQGLAAFVMNGNTTAVSKKKRMRRTATSTNGGGGSASDAVREIIDQSCRKIGYGAGIAVLSKSEDGADATPSQMEQPISKSSPAAAHSAVSPLMHCCFRASWIHTRIAADFGVALLEKERRYADALDLIQVLLGRPEHPTKRGHLWNRFAIDLEHRGLTESSLEVAETALADEWVRGGHRLALQRRVLRLGKPPRRWKKPAFAERATWKPKEETIVGRPIHSKKSCKSRFVGFDDQDVSVEQLAIQHYEQQGWNGVHTENGIWHTLFGLLMWDIIFSDAPDAFNHAFQSAPVDFDTDYFYARRKELIEDRLSCVSDSAENACSLLETVWTREAPKRTLCTGVSWERYTLEELNEVVYCVGGRGLAVILRLLAEDHRNWRSGMPDLFLWRSDPRPRALFAEVKGPRDQLADHQRAWLAELAFGGMDCEVLRVAEPTGRCKSGLY